MQIHIIITNLIIMHLCHTKAVPSTKSHSSTLQGIRKDKKGQRNYRRLHRRPAVELQQEREPQHYPV